MRMGSVNPGIEVTSGVVHYQLLKGQQVRIEDCKWPFAGGELTLQPTVLDFSAEKPRALTFRIIGLQAADFINALELENISARSEEHTSELQSLMRISYAVFCLKKKKTFNQ